MNSLRERITGSWTLVWWMRMVDGHVSASLMRRNRAKLASEDLAAAAPAERAAAYNGRHIELSSDPNWTR